jgi:hypothetical protein
MDAKLPFCFRKHLIVIALHLAGNLSYNTLVVPPKTLKDIDKS